MTDMKDDPKIKNLFHWYGHQGVLSYIFLLEVIAAEMDESDKHSVTLDAKIWKSELRFYRDSTFRKWLESCANLGLISYECRTIPEGISGESITILCPNLLKIRARKKPIGSNKRTLEVEVEEEVDIARSDKIAFDPSLAHWINLEDSKKKIWAETYPAVNLELELKKAWAWAMANPKNRKKNWEAFLVRWLTKAQETAPRVPEGPKPILRRVMLGEEP